MATLRWMMGYAVAYAVADPVMAAMAVGLLEVKGVGFAAMAVASTVTVGLAEAKSVAMPKSLPITTAITFSIAIFSDVTVLVAIAVLVAKPFAVAVPPAAFEAHLHTVAPEIRGALGLVVMALVLGDL